MEKVEPSGVLKDGWPRWAEIQVKGTVGREEPEHLLCKFFFTLYLIKKLNKGMKQDAV
jgi:hypothetical protein